MCDPPLSTRYDWEVNWRKLKLLEEQGNKPVDDNAMEEGLMKRLQAKLGTETPILSPPIDVSTPPRIIIMYYV